MELSGFHISLQETIDAILSKRFHPAIAVLVDLRHDRLEIILRQREAKLGQDLPELAGLDGPFTTVMHGKSILPNVSQSR